MYLLKNFFIINFKNISMPHLRTKRKPTQKNISKLIFSIFIVFILMLFVFSLGNIFKGKKLNLENIFLINKSEENNKVDTEGVWTLQSDSIFLTAKDYPIYIETVNTDEDLAKGLSGKGQLKFYEYEGKMMTEGMLFTFPKEETESFWMKDMNFDLDMIWLDKNYKIVHIEKNALANSYNKNNPDSSHFFSNGNTLAKYVLEINAGLVDKMNIKVGEYLRLQ